MAFSKNLIRSLFPDATNEQIQSIIEAHMESVTALQGERDRYKTEADKVADIQKELNDLKQNSISKEEHQKTLDEFDAYKNQQIAEKNKTQRTDAFKQMLIDAGVKDKFLEMLIENNGKTIDAITFGEDGKVADAEKLTESIKERFSDFIGVVGNQGAPNPTPPGSNGMDADKFKALPVHEQMKYANQHPEAVEWI